MLGLPRLAVQGQEDVGVTRRAVTQPVAFLQQAPPPHHFTALQGLLQVLGSSENLKAGDCKDAFHHRVALNYV